jgi:hypothetical protein
VLPSYQTYLPVSVLYCRASRWILGLSGHHDPDPWNWSTTREVDGCNHLRVGPFVSLITRYLVWWSLSSPRHWFASINKGWGPFSRCFPTTDIYHSYIWKTWQLLRLTRPTTCISCLFSPYLALFSLLLLNLMPHGRRRFISYAWWEYGWHSSWQPWSCSLSNTPRGSNFHSN